MKQFHKLLAGLTIIAVIAAFVLPAVPGALAALPAAVSAGAQGAPNGAGKDLWQHVPGTPSPARAGAQPAVKARRSESYTLSRRGMSALLATAPNEHSQAARKNPLALSLPNPRGGFETFTIEESPIMEPGLAAKHPEIKTYRGRGIDDPAATIRFDLTPLGFHASVRSPQGAWYIDPYYQLDDSLYVTYYRARSEGGPARGVCRA